MKKIAVIGSGTMGNGIAHTFAQHQYTVSLIDVSADALQRALTNIEKNLTRQVEKGTINAKTKTEALNNITSYTNIQEVVQQADLIV